MADGVSSGVGLVEEQKRYAAGCTVVFVFSVCGSSEDKKWHLRFCFLLFCFVFHNGNKARSHADRAELSSSSVRQEG